jgi:DNA-binding NtrC family response regulator
LTKRIAVIDDDPMEAVLLGEIARDISPDFEFIPFARLETFLDAPDQAFELILLDRRLPPYTEFSETLPQIEKTGFKGRVVLMTAHDPGLAIDRYPFAVYGPIDKLELLQVDRLGTVLDGRFTRQPPMQK